jgi:hypothetical protein
VGYWASASTAGVSGWTGACWASCWFWLVWSSVWPVAVLAVVAGLAAVVGVVRLVVVARRVGDRLVVAGRGLRGGGDRLGRDHLAGRALGEQAQHHAGDAQQALAGAAVVDEDGGFGRFGGCRGRGEHGAGQARR